MKFWRSFISLIENYFRDTLSKLDACSDIVCEDMKEYSFKANDEPIKTVKNSSVQLLGDNADRHNLIIQNIGVEPCYIKLGTGLSANDFHFILAADTMERRGNGGSIELKKWHGSVYAICEKKTKLSVLEY